MLTYTNSSIILEAITRYIERLYHHRPPSAFLLCTIETNFSRPSGCGPVGRVRWSRHLDGAGYRLSFALRCHPKNQTLLVGTQVTIVVMIVVEGEGEETLEVSLLAVDHGVAVVGAGMGGVALTISTFDTTVAPRTALEMLLHI